MSKSHKKDQKQVATTEPMTTEEELQARVDDMQEQLNNAQAVNTGMHEQVEQAKDSLKSQQESFKKENGRLIQVEINYKALLKRHNSETYKLKQKMQTLTKARDAAVTVASQSQTRMAERQSEINALKEQLNDLNVKMATKIASIIEVLEGKIADLLKTVEQLTARNKELEEQLASQPVAKE